MQRAAVAITAAAAVAVGFGIAADRAQAAVTATFSPSTQILSVFGDALNNTVTISRDAAGKLLVNNGAVPISGGTPTVANTALVQVFGQGGGDQIILNEANGALPAAFLFGGAGNDTLVGGSGADQLFGQAGDDTLLGKGGNDLLFGGADNDTITGGDGNDQAFGETGNDRMIWNPGDDTDLNEGGDGTDTVEVNGGNGAETFTANPNGTRVRFDRVFPAPFSLDIGTSESLVLNANGGDDTFTGLNGLALLIKLTVDGGAGGDTITGGDGADFLLGGDGNDIVLGGRGDDVAFLGAGDDVFAWNPGDGSDTLEGQSGTDSLQFNGSNISEKINLSANGNRVRLLRDIANIVMDVNGVEHFQLNAKGGADTITVSNLAGTGVQELNGDLAGVPGSGTGDGAADTVIVNGTGGADNAQLFGSGTAAAVIGLPTQVNLTGSEGANDALFVNTVGGDDVVSAATLAAGIVKLTLDGRAGNDTIVGGGGADMLLGGDGNDTLFGGRGNDVALLGGGDDSFSWNLGDGSDTVEGQGGIDTLQFNGANINETFDLSANGNRLRLLRDIASITMDVAGTENVGLVARGGADTITVKDLTGTGVGHVTLELGVSGSGDGAADHVIVNGTTGDDKISVVGETARVAVKGLAATVAVANPEAANDRLDVNTLAGNDSVGVFGGAQKMIQLFVDGSPVL